MGKLIIEGKAALTIVAGVLGLSRQAFYKWLHHKVSARERNEVEIWEVSGEIHDDDPEFGYWFVADELTDRGYRFSEWRVWRLCHEIGVASVISCRRTRSRRAGDPAHDDLFQRHFHADEINVAWVTDVTVHWAGEGKLYLCAIKGLCSRRIVGYATRSRVESSLAVAVFEAAMARRGYP